MAVAGPLFNNSYIPSGSSRGVYGMDWQAIVDKIRSTNQVVDAMIISQDGVVLVPTKDFTMSNADYLELLRIWADPRSYGMVLFRGDPWMIKEADPRRLVVIDQFQHRIYIVPTHTAIIATICKRPLKNLPDRINRTIIFGAAKVIVNNGH